MNSKPKCCEISPADQGLLDAGDYCAEELFGVGGKPSCPKCARSGSEALKQWWGLSYATWLTMPRVLIEAMPEDWQGRLAGLLQEYAAAFPNQPDIGTTVRATSDGKLTPMPEWLLNYRHPNRVEIGICKGLIARCAACSSPVLPDQLACGRCGTEVGR